ncbi:N-acetyltransferase family protein [Enterococcus songbeiensis]
MNINIREATFSDLDAITKLSYLLNKVSAHIEPMYYTLGETDRNFLKNLISNERSIIFVAENESDVIGYISLELKKTPNINILNKYTFTNIIDLVVSKDFEGQGIGKSLLAIGEQWAEKNSDYIDCYVMSKNKNIIRRLRQELCVNGESIPVFKLKH